MKHQTSHPDLKHLVLLGGGHAQIAVLKSLAMRAIEGLRITLISRDVMTPYSGMLPGYLEGQYHADEITIDLSHMARQAGARFIHGEVDYIDPDAKMISIKGRPSLSYDVLSVNIGSNPDLSAIKGAAKFAIPVKPISTLLDRIAPIIHSNDHSDQILTIIGGGAAGVEVALSLDHLMKSQLRNKTIKLIHRGARIMPEFPERAASILMKEMDAKGVEVMTGIGAYEIKKDSIILEDGQRVQSDQTLIVTQGRAPAFLKKCGISLDEAEFIAVSPTLQSQSHPDIFASGDIATVMDAPRPKAGVFAVRAGAILTRNIRAYLFADQPVTWTPQKHYLALVGTGGGKAMPIRGQLVLPPSSWAWRLKTWIDKKFIKKFTEHPEMTAPSPALIAATIHDDDDPAVMAMRCLGCGAKTGWSDLGQAIANAEAFINKTTDQSQISVDITADAAVTVLEGGRITKEMVQSVDAISAIVDDPYMLGRIAALHAISDLYASHAKPHHALALLTLPAAMADLQKDDITQLLAGAMVALDENGAYLAGGHTAQSKTGGRDEMQVGFAVTGFRDQGQIYQPKDGDALIITKPIGIGMVMAGHKQGHPYATGQLRDAAIEVMAQSNGIAAEILSTFGKFPMTDVTGFGLNRHLSSLLSGIGDGVNSAEVMASALPLIQTDHQSVLDLALEGIQSSITKKNKAAAPYETDEEIGLPDALLYDPQTGGGLLTIVPHGQCVDIVTALLDQGVNAAHIGRFSADKNAQIKVRATW